MDKSLPLTSPQGSGTIPCSTSTPITKQLIEKNNRKVCKIRLTKMRGEMYNSLVSSRGKIKEKKCIFFSLNVTVLQIFKIYLLL